MFQESQFQIEDYEAESVLKLAFEYPLIGKYLRVTFRRYAAVAQCFSIEIFGYPAVHSTTERVFSSDKREFIHLIY